MNGSAISAGLNFQERVEEEQQNKKRDNGDDCARNSVILYCGLRRFDNNQLVFSYDRFFSAC
jgi:hypothetical protein